MTELMAGSTFRVQLVEENGIHGSVPRHSLLFHVFTDGMRPVLGFDNVEKEPHTRTRDVH
jgi:hypothetical protein